MRICEIEGCDKKAKSMNGSKVCLMHYTRKRRTGSYELKKRKDRYIDSQGYIQTFNKDHPLADIRGMVREHRVVYYDNVDSNPTNCEMCGKEISWDTLHIDHKDNNRANNDQSNLRALCRACNVYRDRDLNAGCKYIFTINGESMPAVFWAMRDDVCVSESTIVKRKKMGMSDYECVYGKKVTYKAHNPEKPKRQYAKMRQECV